MKMDLQVCDLTLVIPAFNEEKRLPKTLEIAKVFLDSWGVDYEVLVVDDGSHDDTALATSQLGNRFSTLRQDNGGKGSAVRKGILTARGRIVAFTDADLPYDLNALRAGYDLINTKSCEVVFGSRAHAGTTYRVKRRWSRKMASAVFRLLIRLLVSRQVRDTQCGLKIFSQTAARKIFSQSTISGFAFDAEVVYLTHCFQLPFEIIPVTLVNEYSTTISLVRNAFGMFTDILSIRFRSLLGGYRIT